MNKFKLFNSGALLSRGTTGNTPDSGAGTRFMWIPQKNAFRAGSISTITIGNDKSSNLSNTIDDDSETGEITQNEFDIVNDIETQVIFGPDGWDDSNIGNGSGAIGNSIIARGSYSFGSGQQNFASGSGSAVFGFNNVAQGEQSFVSGHTNFAGNLYTAVFGFNNAAFGQRSSAFGQANTIHPNAVNGITFGYRNNVFGNDAVSFGNSNIVRGNNAAVFGFKSRTLGNDGVAFGTETISRGVAATSIGYRTEAAGNQSFAGGVDSISSNTGSFAFGVQAGNQKTRAISVASVALGEGVRTGQEEGTDENENTIPLMNANGALAIGYITRALSPHSIAGGCNSQTGSFIPSLGTQPAVVMDAALSMAFGDNCTTSSCFSLAFGRQSITGRIDTEARRAIPALFSMAFGEENEVLSDHALAFGYKNKIIGANFIGTDTTEGRDASNFSMAFGESNNIGRDDGNAIIQAEHAFVFGRSNDTYSNFSFSFGESNTIGSDTEDTSFLSNFSFAFGQGVTSNGDFAFGFGSGAQATAQGAISMGLSTDASEPGAIALGNNTTSSGAQAFSVGLNCNAEGEQAIAMGCDSDALGAESIAMGYQSKSFGAQSVALGCQSITGISGDETTGFCSTAIGDNAKAIQSRTFALGQFVTANATGAWAIGNGIINEANPSNSTILQNNEQNSLAIGFNSNIPTLFVSTSSGEGTTGNVGIGQITPTSKLHVQGGDIELEDISGRILMKSPDGSRYAVTIGNDGTLITVQA